MNKLIKLLAIFALLPIFANAQVAVTVGTQVTAVNDIVSGKAYRYALCPRYWRHELRYGQQQFRIIGSSLLSHR